MPFKFENLDVWHLALDYIDRIYDLVEQLPRSENFNLTSQIRRASTSVALNIAEGSTGQTDREQVRFLGVILRPYRDLRVPAPDPLSGMHCMQKRKETI